MANYYGSGRTNYFHVKDEPAFRTFIGRFEMEIFRNDDDAQLFALGMGYEDGSLPSFVTDPETDEETEIDFIDELRKHIADGEVVVFISAGAEKLRYISGTAVAFTSNPDQGVLQINLDDIYEKAREVFDVGQITVAEY